MTPEQNYIIITTDGYDWPFMITDKGIRYRTGLGRFVEIPKVPTVGWENNFDFGSGRRIHLVENDPDAERYRHPRTRCGHLLHLLPAI